MRWKNFKTRVPGKWVLAGEHSVLRGAPAVALPHPEIGLSMSFSPNSPIQQVQVETDLAVGCQLEGLRIEPPDAESVIKDLLVSTREAWAKRSHSQVRLEGRLKIESSIPIGAGLGSSAALCVALTQWLAQSSGLEDPEEVQEGTHHPVQNQIQFATRLEHHFHGRSSGMDVAVISMNEPISFIRGQGDQGMRAQPLGVKCLPHFTFHDTGLRSRTSECVVKVDGFRKEFSEKAKRVDETMAVASRRAMEGLILFDAQQRVQGLKKVQESIQMARQCFYDWDLVPDEVRRLEEKLLLEGALAVKLTGAGGGGILVALWEGPPSP